METGSPTVDCMIGFNITGNIHAHNWNHNITYKNGHAHMNAVAVLGEIVYWYRPKIIYDPITNKPVRYEKKFKEDKWQCNYEPLAKKLKITKRQAQCAVKKLSDMGLVTKEFRTVVRNGVRSNNVLYLDLIVDKLKEVTYNGPYPIHSNAAPMTLECNSLSQQDVIGPTLECETNTEIITETSIENSYLIDEAEAYASYIRERVGMALLLEEVPARDRMLVVEIVEIIIGILISKRDSIRINNSEVPYSYVKSRFMKLNKEHIKYVIECMNNSNTEIRNMKAYIVTTLYNAPATMANYYLKKVQSDARS